MGEYYSLSLQVSEESEAPPVTTTKKTDRRRSMPARLPSPVSVGRVTTRARSRRDSEMSDSSVVSVDTQEGRVTRARIRRESEMSETGMLSIGSPMRSGEYIYWL